MAGSGELLAEWAERSSTSLGDPRGAGPRDDGGGRDVLLELDVQGARQVREVVPEAVLVLLEPSIEVSSMAVAPEEPRRRTCSPDDCRRPSGSSANGSCSTRSS